MQINIIEGLHRSGTQVPLISVINGELEMSVFALVRLFHDRVLESVAEPQRTEAVHIVVHPLVHWRCLFANGL